MTANARVYYRDNGRTPDFVIVVRDTSPTPTQLADVKITETGDDHWGIVVRALTEIGYRPAGETDRIVRQADGIGSLPVVADLKPVTVHVTRGSNGSLGQVIIGESSRSLPPGIMWPQADAVADLVQVRATIDRAIVDLGYIRTGGLIPAVGGFEAPVEPAEWRDHPTLVRVTDAASDLLSRAAMTLGIPADALASTWIHTAAADALRRHQWFTAPGTIVDHRRIGGWLHDGSPDLINTGTPPTGRSGIGGSGS